MKLLDSDCSPNADSTISPRPIFCKIAMGDFDSMKGFTVLFTIVLLVVAEQLAGHLKRTGALPAQKEASRAVAAWGPEAAARNGALKGVILEL